MTQAFGPGAVVTTAFHPKTGPVPFERPRAVTFKGLRALATSGFRTVTVLTGGQTRTFALTLA